ncbi:aspartate/glutamate racemase family protein [Ancylobacter sp. SL191]|uniref:aspartate/glutamate racemase family protein n=1 Tax=Ancylobacter sp. SL191 TaxID=2995166 RepID=UPI002271D4EB|nr:aspartate/glutamate racemase family protein [Ancylobacter sp. SL191]WAC27590.1 aspartate/glutamate racemase family protein [Ancylobacter sp. SL191]
MSNPSHRLAVLHTVPALAQALRPRLEATLPGWGFTDIVDESLLAETIREGRLTEATKARLAQHLTTASREADAILVTCSTLGEAVDALATRLNVPVFRIDRGMAEIAVQRARRIGVLATLPTTLGPTGRLIRDTARDAGRSVEVTERLCEGAFARLAAGDRAGHDSMVQAGFAALTPQVDLVVLAQASMANALVGHEGAVPVLTSPAPGIAAVAAALTSPPV